MCAVQWTGHLARISLNTACGGPSCHSSSSAISTLRMSLSTDAIGTSLIGLPVYAVDTTG